MKNTLLGLACFLIVACASDGQYYKTELINGNYEEVAFELSYDVTFQDGGQMYGNYKLGMLALYNLYPTENSMDYVTEYTEFEDLDSDTLRWSQERIAKEFFLKSAKAGFTPAMVQLAGLLDSESDERFGDSFTWLFEAASMGNSVALEVLQSKDIDTSKLKINKDYKIYEQVVMARGIDYQFSSHDPQLAARRKREAEQQLDETFDAIGKSALVLLAVGLAAEALPSSDDSLRTRNLKTSIVNGFLQSRNNNQYGYAWDAFYNEYHRIVWRCRNKENGQFANDRKCSGMEQTDSTWPEL